MTAPGSMTHGGFRSVSSLPRPNPQNECFFFSGFPHLAGRVSGARNPALTGRRARAEGPARTDPGATVIGGTHQGDAVTG